MRTPISLSFDLGVKSLVTPADPNVVSTQTTQVYVENEYVLCLNIYNVPPTKVNLSGTVSYKLGIGYLDGVAPLLESNNAQFNIPGDWALVNPTNGLISVRVDTNNAALEADLGSDAYKSYYLEVKAQDAIGDSTVLLCPITVFNTVYT